MNGAISVPHMESSKKAKPTPADVAAARRLKAYWDARARDLKLTQDSIADELGITQGAVSQYLNGKIPMNYRTLVVFCRALGVDDTEIRTDLPEQRLMPGAANDPDYDDVPAYAQAVGLGAGTEADEYAETHALKFKTSSLRKQGLLNRQLAVYYGKGDSMEPRIKTGDAILFDQTDTRPVDGEIFIVSWRGEIYAKRIEIVDDLVLVKSDNPHGDHHWRKPKRLDNPREPIEILGRVRWIGSWEG